MEETQVYWVTQQNGWTSYFKCQKRQEAAIVVGTSEMKKAIYIESKKQMFGK